MSDSDEYRQKKAFFQRLITIYGRNAVAEALQDPQINVFRLHLADSNKKGGIIDRIQQQADSQGIETQYHSRQALSRISRNAKQDQGVAADIQADSYRLADDFLAQAPERYQIIALDGITNPQNLGMILRSACAGGSDAVLWPEKGCADMGPLVIKASAGTLFKTPILRCPKLLASLQAFKDDGAAIYSLSSHAQQSLFSHSLPAKSVFVLGNETEGVSREIMALADNPVSIPMANGVESLNVAVTAGLIAYYQQLQRQ